MQALDLIHALGDREAVFDWVPLPCTTIEITADAVCVGGLRVTVSARTARRVADELAGVDPEGRVVSLPTADIVDLAFHRAKGRPPPVVFDLDVPWPWDPSWAPPPSTDAARQRSHRLGYWRLLAGWGRDELVAPVGLEWVRDDAATQHRARSYGWLPVEGQYRPRSSEHDLDYRDDRHVLRLVRWRSGADVPGLSVGECAVDRGAERPAELSRSTSSPAASSRARARGGPYQGTRRHG